MSAKLDLLRPRSQKVKQDMLDKLVALREKVTIGIVGGSDINKQYEQLGETGELSGFCLERRPIAPDQPRYRSAEGF